MHASATPGGKTTVIENDKYTFVSYRRGDDGCKFLLSQQKEADNKYTFFSTSGTEELRYVNTSIFRKGVEKYR
jgi:hypothetical protein